jgi:ParB family transcriptional regulator, chromosome partitioning protein
VANTGIGRGLAAILELRPEDGQPAAELRAINVELIGPNPNQPRRRFDEEALSALADSLADQGVLQPVLVRPLPGGSYELVAGERRWRAAQIAGLEQIPAIVESRDDTEALEAAIVENMARADLNPVEEARAVAALVEELGMTKKAVGRRVGRSRSAISNLLRILDLPDPVLSMLEDGALSEGHGRALLLADDHADRSRLARSAKEGGWSVRVLEDRARKANQAEGGKRRKAGKGAESEVHPDQADACERIAQTLGEAFGREVKVRPRGTSYKAEITIEDAADADLVAGLISARRLS